MNIRVQLRATADHTVSLLQADRSTNLGSPNSVIQEVGVARLANRQLHVGLLGADDLAGQGSLDTVCVDGGGSDGRVEAIVQPRDGHEPCWLENLQVIDQSNNITTEEADGRSLGQGGLVDHPSVNVSQGQVGDVDVLVGDSSGGSRSRKTSHGVAMGQNDTLGHACGPRSVVDGDVVGRTRRAHGAARLQAERLDVGHGVDLNAMLGSDTVQDRQLGVASRLAGVQGVEADDELEGGESWRKLQQDRNVR